MNSLIVPVWLSHQKDPSHKVLVYALLDDQSDTTFIAKETLYQLGVHGHQTQLLLSTMHGRDTAIPSEKVNGLLVQDFKCEVTIPLPNTFSAQTIPARREQIPKPETALNWSHMKKIAEQLMPYRDDVKVGLLIGSNCTRAIMPREVIPGRHDDPYALRTDLGWGIVGRVRWGPDHVWCHEPDHHREWCPICCRVSEQKMPIYSWNQDQGDHQSLSDQRNVRAGLLRKINRHRHTLSRGQNISKKVRRGNPSEKQWPL